MSPETCRKTRAVLLMTMLALAEAQQILQKGLPVSSPGSAHVPQPTSWKDMSAEDKIKKSLTLFFRTKSRGDSHWPDYTKKLARVMGSELSPKQGLHVADHVENMMWELDKQKQNQKKLDNLFAHQFESADEMRRSLMETRMNLILFSRMEQMRNDPEFHDHHKELEKRMRELKRTAFNNWKEDEKFMDDEIKKMLDNFPAKGLSRDKYMVVEHQIERLMVDKLFDRALLHRTPQAALKPVGLSLLSTSTLPRFGQRLRSLPFGRVATGTGTASSSTSRLSTAAMKQHSQHSRSPVRLPAKARLSKQLSDAWALVVPALLMNFMVASQALADEAYTFQGSSASMGVTGLLFLLTAPGLWSLVKRSPTASKKRITFEMTGPAKGGKPLDTIAREVAAYFKKYNYRITGTGEVITFTGTYEASRGVAAATTFYFFCGLASIALVLSIAVPKIGPLEVAEKWYFLTLLTPLAWVYYTRKGTRDEECKIKMVQEEDESLTDLIIEGDKEEIDRLARELQLVEKGKVKVKGIFESNEEEAKPKQENTD